MLHDPVRLADARAWLAKAHMDLRAAAHELTAVPPFTADAGLSCAAGDGEDLERLPSLFLAWHDTPFRQTHDLAEIGRQCVSIDRSLESLLIRAAELTQYAWKFRYPGEPGEPSLEEANVSIDLAREVYEAIVARVPPESELT